MGRHARDATEAEVEAALPRTPEGVPEPSVDPRRPVPPDGAPEVMLGWGAFATVLAGVLAGWVDHSWTSALPVTGLGAGGTALLWAVARGARRPVRRHARPRGAGHRSGTSRARSVKCPRDQRKR